MTITKIPTLFNNFYLFIKTIIKKIPSSFYNITLIVFVWRLSLEAINQFLAPLVNQYYNSIPFKESFYRWNRWDGGWYRSVVITGYHYINTTTQQNVAFFPAFPALVRLIHNVTQIPYLFSGLLLNFTLTVGTAFIAYKLSMIFILKYTSKSNQTNDYLPAIIAIALPTSFYFGAFYADALLVFGLISAIYFGLKSKYLLAAMFGGLASGTNPIGIVAIPTLLFMFIEQEHIFLDYKNKIKQSIVKLVSMIFLGSWGLITYMLYLWIRFGNPIVFYKVEKAWGRSSATNFLTNLVNIWNTYYINIFNIHYFGDAHFEYLIGLSDAIIPILALILLIITGCKKIWWLFIYILLITIIPMSTGTLSSMNRFSLNLLPAFIFAYILIPSRQQKYSWSIVYLSVVTEIILVTVYLVNSTYLVG